MLTISRRRKRKQCYQDSQQSRKKEKNCRSCLYYFLVVKKRQTAAVVSTCDHSLANYRKMKTKKSRAKKIIMFLLTVQQTYKFFLFSAIFRMRFSEREPNRKKKSTKMIEKIPIKSYYHEKKNKKKQKSNLCFDSRRWKALNAADLYKSNLIKNRWSDKTKKTCLFNNLILT